MQLNYPTPSLLPAQRALWQEAFGDEDSFLDAFFAYGYSPLRSRCITIDGHLAAAIYWFDCAWQDKKVAYLYALAVAEKYRGQGLAHKLMADVESLLSSQNYAGAILVPGNEGLFAFYGKMGYIPINCAENITVSPTSPIPVRKIDKAEYDRLRRGLLGQNAATLGSENCCFLSSVWQLYAGDRWVLAAFDNGSHLIGMELLGDASAAGGILAALGKGKSTFRIPGNDPFAMYKPLCDSGSPDYFGLAFD